MKRQLNTTNSKERRAVKITLLFSSDKREIIAGMTSARDAPFSTRGLVLCWSGVWPIETLSAGGLPARLFETQKADGALSRNQDRRR